MVTYLDELYRYANLHDITIFQGDQKHLQKMFKLWPPYDVFYFTLMSTAAIYVLIRKLLKPAEFWKLFSDKPLTGTSMFFLRILTSSLAATATFAMLLQMERLAELSLLVLTLNFLHTQLVFLITTLTLSFSYVESEKTKTE
ncbi:unnamed protein product [Auanema sp. JU1783]|nr:unnamed protein product [Auanema sp. JU1783]